MQNRNPSMQREVAGSNLNKQGGRYRSYAAQNVHKIIMKFLYGQVTEAKVREVFEAECNACARLHKPDCFGEASIHGHTHLLDILNLSLAIAKENNSNLTTARDVAIQLAMPLFQLIFNTVTDINTIRFLLTKPDNDGLTPIHAILRLGNQEMLRLFHTNVQTLAPEMLRDMLLQEHGRALNEIWTNVELCHTIPEYFQLLVDVFKKGIINDADFNYFMTSTDRYGYTLFHKVMRVGSAAPLAVRDMLILAININASMPQETMHTLLLSTSRDKFSPMHAIAAQPDESVLARFLSLGRQYVLKGDRDPNKLTPQQYSRLFIGETHAHLSPGHVVFHNPHHASVATFITEIEWAQANDFLSLHDFKMLWMSVADNKSTLLSCAIESGQLENVRSCLTVLSKLHYAEHPEHVTYPELLTLLQQNAFMNETLMHLAAATGELSIVQELVRFIRSVLPNDAITLLHTLMTAMHTGHAPHCPENKSGAREVNAYLQSLRKVSRMSNLEEVLAYLASLDPESVIAAPSVAATAAATMPLRVHSNATLFYQAPQAVVNARNTPAAVAPPPFSSVGMPATPATTPKRPLSRDATTQEEARSRQGRLDNDHESPTQKPNRGRSSFPRR